MENHQTLEMEKLTQSDITIFGIYAKLKDGYDSPIIIDSEETDVYVQAAYLGKFVPGKLYSLQQEEETPSGLCYLGG